MKSTLILLTHSSSSGKVAHSYKWIIHVLCVCLFLKLLCIFRHRAKIVLKRMLLLMAKLTLFCSYSWNARSRLPVVNLHKMLKKWATVYACYFAWSACQRTGKALYTLVDVDDNELWWSYYWYFIGYSLFSFIDGTTHTTCVWFGERFLVKVMGGWDWSHVRAERFRNDDKCRWMDKRLLGCCSPLLPILLEEVALRFLLKI